MVPKCRPFIYTPTPSAVQSVDPPTIDPANHERRNSGIYDELNFGTVNDGQDYETNVPAENLSSKVCDNPSEGRPEQD